MNPTHNHTPGPWKALGLEIIGNNNNCLVADIHPDNPWALEDANLVAAAPDLLAALEAIAARAASSMAGPAPDLYHKGGQRMASVLGDMATAAIAKARGGA